MLAQEEAVINRGPGTRKGVEAAFGMGGETEGTLILTDQRLVYVHGEGKEVDQGRGLQPEAPLFHRRREPGLDAHGLREPGDPDFKTSRRSRTQGDGHRPEARGEMDRPERSHPRRRVRPADDWRFEAEEPQRLGEGDREAEGEAAEDNASPTRAGHRKVARYSASSGTCGGGVDDYRDGGGGCGVDWPDEVEAACGRPMEPRTKDCAPTDPYCSWSPSDTWAPRKTVGAIKGAARRPDLRRVLHLTRQAERPASSTITPRTPREHARDVDLLLAPFATWSHSKGKGRVWAPISSK